MITQEILIDEIRKLAPASCVEISINSSLRDELAFSSLKLMMLIVYLEDLLDCSIPMENFHEIHTVGDLLMLVKKVENQNERL